MERLNFLSKEITYDAVKYLRKVDSVMGYLIDQHPLCSIAEREYRPFHTLVTSIIGQQLSAKAADTIEQRISSLTSIPFQVKGFLTLSAQSLRAAGLSQAKIKYIFNLAEKINSGQLDLEALLDINDEKVIKILCEFPGVGRWTAEMFLIFGLKRSNILSLGDAGLQRAVRIIYGSKLKAEVNLENVARPWNPYCSVASWYLWRHLEVVG